MVYVASLGFPAKKALASKCHQSNINSIIKTLAIDPEVSQMDVVVFGPNDLSGSSGKKVRDAVASKHEDICVIYLYTSEKDGRLFPEAPHSQQVKKIDGLAIEAAVNDFYGQDLQVKEQKYKSSDDTVGKNPTVHNVERVDEPMEEEEHASAPAQVEMDIAPIVEEDTEGTEAPPIVEEKQPSVEDMIESIKEVKDWEILHKQLERDSIIRQLILENNEFAGLAKMLDVYDLRIRDVWADPYKTNEDKMKAVQEFGTDRMVLQSTYNSVLVDKFVSLIGRVVSVCSRAAEERINDISQAVVSIHTNKDAFLELAVSGESSSSEKLYTRMVELQYIEGELCKMLDFMYGVGTEDIIGRLNEKLPSTNEFINNVLSVSASLYVPSNSTSLGNIVFDALQKGQIQFSMVEDKIKALMTSLFNVVIAQHEVIEYQRDAITCLRANHVEELVVRDSLLKDCFHVVVGKENTGLSSTVATIAGMKSRQNNTLVVDLTGHPHYDRYGYTAVPLDDFMAERVQQPLLFVVGTVHDDPERVFQLMEEMKSRLTYFHNIIVVLDTSQTMILDQIGREALSISYITNCTTESMDAVAEAYDKSRSIPNVGRKLICIDSPVDVGQLLSVLKMDISMTQLIPLPYLREMRQAAIVHQQPHTYNDVLRIFEEAFRV